MLFKQTSRRDITSANDEDVISTTAESSFLNRRAIIVN